MNTDKKTNMSIFASHLFVMSSEVETSLAIADGL
jgi:hypothetical protein